MSNGSQYAVDEIPKYMMINLDPSRSITLTRRTRLMAETPLSIALVETSFAQAIEQIEASSSLPDHLRQHWPCSMRQIAKALDRPLELVPARWTAIRMSVDKIHHARLGLTAKTVANHKANVRAALRWVHGEHGTPVRGAPLDPGWEKLRDLITHKGIRARLYGLMRFGSAKGVSPDDVTDEFLGDYLRYRAETTNLASGAQAARSVARSWNSCVDQIAAWPRQRLTAAPVRPSRTLPWDEVPAGLREGVDAYLRTFEGLRRTLRASSGDGPAPRRRRHSAAKASSIHTRRAEIRAFVRKAVEIGVPLDELTSLPKLLHPDVSERVLQAYWDKDGDLPKGYTIDLGWKILSIARQTGGLDEVALDRLDDMRAELETHRRSGLTDKNLAVIRQVTTTSVWREVLQLPSRLMEEARELRDHAPVKAALRAQLAVATGILTVAPVRLGNLVRIKLEENLVRPGGPLEPYCLMFPDYDVKNRVKLEFNLKASLTALIEEYVHQHRPVLLRGTNERWLFPGEGGSFKTPNMFGEQITDAVERRVGIRVTAHQYRHAAAALILRAEPGNYEWARRVLGHKSMRTTINFYLGLETAQATERFGDIVREQLERTAQGGLWC